MIYKFFSKFIGSKGTSRRSLRPRQPGRRLAIETLESRQLLSITLPVISGQTLLAGAPLNIALNGLSSAGNAVNYTVAVTNSSLTNSAQLTTTIPQGNPSLKITVSDAVDGIYGDMVLQLFKDLAPETVAKITSLADEGFYNGLTFHRIIADFMIQGGDPNGDGTGGPGFEYDNEVDSALQFTSSGLLAMANSGPDTNGSQFFITDAATRWLDFRYTIFGFLTEGDSVRQALNTNVPTDSSTDKPTNTVTMTSVTSFTDTQNGVLRLSAPVGATGSADVTVTATDSVTGETTSQSFYVTVAADTNVSPPFLGTVAPIQTTVNTSVTFNIPAIDVNGNAMTYTATISPANSNLTVSVDSSTGQVTLTPANGVSGVFGVQVGVTKASATSSDTADTQVVPVYVSPAGPTRVTLSSASDTGTSSDALTNLNNTAGKTLQFQVDGVLSGASVEVFADGVSIGSATASGTSVVVTTNGTATLADGTRSITAKQTLKNEAVAIGNLDTTTDLASSSSSAVSIAVDTTAPQVTFTPGRIATVGALYTCQAATSTETSGTITYQLTQSPSGMVIDASTGLIHWTPVATQAPSANVTVMATDKAGNSVQQQYTISVASANSAPVLVTARPSLGSTDRSTAKVVLLTGTFINNGTATTTITDADSSAVVGGIALIGVTGAGAWEYSTDGSTFQSIGAVSSASALLLTKDAQLRYTTAGTGSETPTITYRAWDMTTGSNAGRANLSSSSSVGGATAFSSVTDTALLTVNDAPVLTATSPSLGTAHKNTPATATVIELSVDSVTQESSITDVDQNAVVGGIAVVGITGSGTWTYSTDGVTFQSITSASATSALLLAHDAKLRYTPAGTAESATITFRAWDTTAGTNGGREDISLTAATGGTTAFSSVTDTATLTVADVTDSTVLTPAAPSLGGTASGTAKTINITGTFINNGSGTTTITVTNTSAVAGGIALTSVVGYGTWETSIDDGATFQEVTGVSDSSALLLGTDAILRYTPADTSEETATITYRAWDATSGTSGNMVDLSGTDAVGGTTGYSLFADTASLTVNDAPVLTAASPSMGATDEDTPVTISLSTFINNDADTGTIIRDANDGSVLGGIAITALTGGGTWEYSLDDTTFQTITSVSSSSALLLPQEASLRYTPGGNNGETATISYRAWDTTSGAGGDRADLSSSSATGGSTAFSTASDTASLTVAGVNESPVLTPVNPSLGSTTPSAATSISLTGTFINNGTSGTIITDVDSGATVGGIAVTGLTGNGTWAYSLDGSTFTAVGIASTSSALLLPKTATLRYTPDGSTLETATITYCAWDATSGTSGNKVDTTTNGDTTAFSTASDTASLTVSTTTTNSAPDLTPANPTLGTTAPTTAKTFALTGTFIDNGDGTSIIADADSGAVLGDIALIGATGNGTWAYSLDGSTFTSVGTLSSSSALLLPKTASLRYTPDGTSTETATISYRAWDTTSGTSGGTADTTTNGGTTAFSTDTDTASLTVGAGTATISGYVYIDSNNDGLRLTPKGTNHPGLSGVTVRLFSEDTDGTWTEVAGKSPTQTAADGSYSFSGVAAGNYQVRESQPDNVTDGLETAGTIASATVGTVGADQIDVTIASGDVGTEYNFGERGLLSSLVSLRMFLASTPPVTQVIQGLHAAPAVDLTAATSGSNYATTYSTNGSTVAIAGSDATITSTDSPTLVSMTVTITNRLDGSYEKLAVDSSSTYLTSSYANGILTISGVADLDVYQTLLTGITYSDTAASPTSGDRAITVVINDGTVSRAAATTTVTVNAPAATITLSNSVVAENQSSGTVVGTLAATSSDGGTNTFSLVTGTGSDDNASFTISGSQLLTGASFDYETKSSYSVRLRSTSSTSSYTEQALTITVSNVNETPTAIALSNSSVAGGQAVGTVVGQLSSTDPDSGDTFTYSLVTGTGSDDNASFTISGSQLLTGATFDAATKSSYTVRVRTTDQGGLYTEQAFTITITSASTNHAPTAIALSNATIAENQPAGTVVGQLSTTDPDSGDTFTYSLVSGTGSDDNASFAISGIQLTSAVSFDFETKGSYTVLVRSIDQGGLFTEQAFTITITNANDAPTAIALSNSSVATSQATGTVVGQLTTTDQDSGDTFTYSLVSGDGSDGNASFAINGSQLTTAAVLDVATQSSYTVRVRSTDQGGLYTDQVFTITVAGVNGAPTAIALSNSAISENQAAGTVIGQMSTTDPNSGDMFSYSLVSGDGSDDNSAFAIDGSQLKANTSFDFEAKSSYTVRVRSTDQGGLSTEQAFTIAVTDVGNSMTLSSSSVAENQPAGTQVGTFAMTDPSSGDTYTFALTNSETNADNGMFSISGNQLLTNAPFDLETKGTYSIMVRGSNQSGSFADQALTITVGNVNETPSAVTLSNGSVAENQSVGTVVGQFGTTDPDSGDTFTYTLVTGTGGDDNGSFTINGNQLKTGASFDFETRTTYTIRVRSVDQGGLSTEQSFTIMVTGANDAPTDVAVSSSSVAESQPLGTLVGLLSTTDVDTADTFTYILVSGDGSDGNSSFTIDGNQLKTNALLDFETKASYTIRVRSTDQGGLFTEHVFTMSVTDVANAVTLSDSSIAENLPAGTVVGSLGMADPNAGDTFTYTLVSGDGSNGNGSFTIDGSQLKTGASFDYETQTSYTIRVRSTSQADVSMEQVFTVDVTNVVNVPTLSNAGLPENQPAGSVVGTLGMADPASGSTTTYTLVAGDGSAGNGSFTINSSGDLTTAASFDFETKNTYTIRVRGTDQNDAFVDQVFAIAVNNVNETPTAIILSNSSIAENEPVGTMVGLLTATDPDIGNTFTYTLVTGDGSTDNASFSIEGGQLKTGASFDFETKTDHTVRVRSADQDGLFTEQAFTIAVANVNEAPTAIDLSNKSIAENEPVGAVVGLLTTNDPDAGSTFTYTLETGTGGDDIGSFTIEGNQLKTGISLDFEAKPSYTVRVRSTDGDGLFTEQPFTITVTNVNETPTAITLTGDSVAENQTSGTVVGRLGTADPDAGGSFTYTLADGDGSTDNGSFTIDGDQLKAGASFDFETKPSYTVRVRSTDQDGLFTEQAFTITVTDVDEAPTAISLAGNTVVENQPSGTVVGQLSTADPDVGNSFTFSLVTGTGGDDNGSFTIDGNQLKTNASFNFEARNSYTVRVRSTDQDGLYAEQAFTITVTDVNEAPAAITLSSSTVADNQPSETLVGLLGTADQDAGNTFTYSLVAGTGSDDNGSFAIDGNQLKTGVSLSSTTKSTYTVRVQSVDQGALAVEQTLVITIGDVSPALTGIALSNSGVAQNQDAGATVGQLSTTGPAVGATQIYSLVSGTGSDDNGSFTLDGSTLKTSTPLTVGTKTIRVRSSTFYLASDVVSLTGSGGAYVVQVNYDPAELPAGLEQSLANGGSISLGSNRLGGWSNAVAADNGAAGSLAQSKVLGSWNDFWTSVQAANPSATESDVLGSWGIDTTNNTVWAVVDYSSEFAVEVGVFTEQTFTVTVTA